MKRLILGLMVLIPAAELGLSDGGQGGPLRRVGDEADRGGGRERVVRRGTAEGGRWPGGRRDVQALLAREPGSRLPSI